MINRLARFPGEDDDFAIIASSKQLTMTMAHGTLDADRAPWVRDLPASLELVRPRQFGHHLKN